MLVIDVGEVSLFYFFGSSRITSTRANLYCLVINAFGGGGGYCATISEVVLIHIPNLVLRREINQENQRLVSDFFCPWDISNL
jgi:hypothetical protein